MKLQPPACLWRPQQSCLCGLQQWKRKYPASVLCNCEGFNKEYHSACGHIVFIHASSKRWGLILGGFGVYCILFTKTNFLNENFKNKTKQKTFSFQSPFWKLPWLLGLSLPWICKTHLGAENTDWIQGCVASSCRRSLGYHVNIEWERDWGPGRQEEVGRSLWNSLSSWWIHPVLPSCMC